MVVSTNNYASSSSSSYSTWGIRTSFQFLTFIIIALLISALYLTKPNDGPPSASSLPSPPPPMVVEERGARAGGGGGGGEEDVAVVKASKDDIMEMPKCDLFSGKWVYDNESYPLYKEKECSFMSDQLACEKFGRKDLSYQHWRWQPHHCDLPRFNGIALLERLRNKRLMFVGDSLNRGQWISMLCLVETNIPPSLKSIHTNGSLTTFKALEYNASIEFYWAPLLVESNSDDPIMHRVPQRIVRTQAIEKHARHWTDADILVFDSYLWWRMPTMKILWGAFESPEGIYKQVEMLKGYEMALRTWSDWLEIHVNHSKTQVFWMSMSPTHERSEEWGGEKGLNCYNETQPIFKQDYWGSGSDTNMMKQVEFEIEKLSKKGLNIHLLNITQLSEYRKDAHLSIYKKQWEPIREDQLANPVKNADCFHWCLPGVPDTWNEILNAYIFNYL